MTTISLERMAIEVMPDRELLKRLVRVADNERHLTADVLALLAECDARRLYLGEGCSSLFTYCTQVLHFSEHAAYHRIEAARAARQFPIILELVANGSVTLTTVALLRPHLTPNNHRELLTAARHRTKREVEYQIACLAPKPDVQTVIRRLPAYTPAQAAAAAKAAVSSLLALAPDVHLDDSAQKAMSTSAPGTASTTGPSPKPTSDLGTASTAAPADTPTSAQGATSAFALNGREAGALQQVGDDSASKVPPPSTPLSTAEPRSQVTPLAADRYLLRVTLSAETHAKFRRAQQLMGHRVPDGDPHAIIGRALSLLVEHLERAKFARVRPARRGSEGTSTVSITPASANTSASANMSAAAKTSATANTPESASTSRNLSRSAALSTSESSGTAVSASTGGSRHIPAAMRRHVWARDEGRCAFVGTLGRCTETRRLEFHHLVPFARGGPTSVGNLALRCRSHNVYESDQAFGARIQQGHGHPVGTEVQETSRLDESPH